MQDIIIKNARLVLGLVVFFRQYRYRGAGVAICEYLIVTCLGLSYGIANSFFVVVVDRTGTVDNTVLYGCQKLKMYPQASFLRIILQADAHNFLMYGG